MRRFKKPLIGLVLLFVVYTLLGFFALPPILKSILIKKLSENLQREVTIEKIKVNPYILSLTAQGFKVKERGSSETFAACDEIFSESPEPIGPEAGINPEGDPDPAAVSSPGPKRRRIL